MVRSMAFASFAPKFLPGIKKKDVPGQSGEKGGGGGGRDPCCKGGVEVLNLLPASRVKRLLL